MAVLIHVHHRRVQRERVLASLGVALVRQGQRLGHVALAGAIHHVPHLEHHVVLRARARLPRDVRGLDFRGGRVFRHERPAAQTPKQRGLTRARVAADHDLEVELTALAPVLFAHLDIHLADGARAVLLVCHGHGAILRETSHAESGQVRTHGRRERGERSRGDARARAIRVPRNPSRRFGHPHARLRNPTSRTRASAMSDAMSRTLGPDARDAFPRNGDGRAASRRAPASCASAARVSRSGKGRGAAGNAREFGILISRDWKQEKGVCRLHFIIRRRARAPPPLPFPAFVQDAAE